VYLRGITKIEACALSGALRRLALTPAIANAVAWYAEVTELLAGARAEQRWISTETVDALLRDLRAHGAPGGAPRPQARRSQQAGCRCLNWARMDRVADRWLPPARIMHPWPSVRFDARTQGRSPVR